MSTLAKNHTDSQPNLSVFSAVDHANGGVDSASNQGMLDKTANVVSAAIAMGISICFACYGWHVLYEILLRVSVFNSV